MKIYSGSLPNTSYHAFSPGTLSLPGPRPKTIKGLTNARCQCKPQLCNYRRQHEFLCNIALLQRKFVLNYAFTVEMTDNLEPLSVEELNVAMNKAVNAAFLPQGFTQKPKYANVLPGEYDLK